MLKAFEKHIKTHFPYLEKQPFLMAVSGGIDSVVLTHLLHQLGYTFSVCHCNFKLRDLESDKDEKFVVNLAKKLNLNCHTTSFNTKQYANEKKHSIQIAARELRYQWFYELLKNHNYNYVLTAHNADDNLETFLINLTRESGLDGFTGIPPKNEQTLRPLLPFSRKEIEDFAKKNSILWREDKTNTDTKYTRNKIRHNVIPVLKEINPNLLSSFQNTLSHLQESKQIIDDRMDAISSKIVSKTQDTISINIEELSKLSNQKAYLYQLLHSYGFTEWNDVVKLTSAQSGKQLFSETHRLIKDRTNLLLIEKENNKQFDKSYEITEKVNEITTPISLFFSEKSSLDKTENNQILVDKDLLKYPLIVRKWKDGDYICPTGMQGRKKLSQLFKDKKMSLLEKENTWLLVNGDQSILWVIGLRQDRRFATTKQTKNNVLITHK